MSVTVYDFVTLRSGHVMEVLVGTPLSMSASPAAVVQAPSPGTHTPTAAPGTPYSVIVWSSAASSFTCRGSGRSPSGAGGRVTVGAGVSAKSPDVADVE